MISTAETILVVEQQPLWAPQLRWLRPHERLQIVSATPKAAAAGPPIDETGHVIWMVDDAETLLLEWLQRARRLGEMPRVLVLGDEFSAEERAFLHMWGAASVWSLPVAKERVSAWLDKDWWNGRGERLHSWTAW